ncbi:hypothetical protein EV363DRAFT_1293377 [Boletus edulis]|nr:hypothetical protein EV363DRAFT_1293377 [Boletus edulis]
MANKRNTRRLHEIHVDYTKYTSTIRNTRQPRNTRRHSSTPETLELTEYQPKHPIEASSEFLPPTLATNLLIRRTTCTTCSNIWTSRFNASAQVHRYGFVLASVVITGCMRVWELPESDGNFKHDGDVNSQSPWPDRGQIKIREVKKDTEREAEHYSDVDGVKINWKCDGKAAATSAACRRSKRLKTNTLAENKANRHGQCKYKATDVPEAPKHPSNISEDLQSIQTHRVAKDHLNRILETSVPLGRLTKSPNRIEAQSGELDALD